MCRTSNRLKILLINILLISCARTSIVQDEIVFTVIANPTVKGMSDCTISDIGIIDSVLIRDCARISIEHSGVNCFKRGCENYYISDSMVYKISYEDSTLKCRFIMQKISIEDINGFYVIEGEEQNSQHKMISYYDKTDKLLSRVYCRYVSCDIKQLPDFPETRNLINIVKSLNRW